LALTIYEQVAEDIRKQIKSGSLLPGDRLPSESEFTQMYKTTRMTIRKGLTLLSEGRFIYSVPGKGYFVCQPDSNRHLLNFNEMEMIREHVTRTQLLEVNIVAPSRDLVKKLRLEKNQKVVLIRRLFYARKEPFAYDVKYLPFDKGKPLVEEVIHYATFPEIVASRATLFALKNQLDIYAKKAAVPESDCLMISAGQPLLVIEQTLFDGSNKPVGWGQIFFRAEYGRLHAVSAI